MRKIYAPQHSAKTLVAADLVQARIGGQVENGQAVLARHRNLG
jgi:hypothetical protein